MDSPSKVSSAQPKSAVRSNALAICAFGAACIAVLVVVGLYVGHFFGRRLGDVQAWASFGDYVGGSLSATFGFITVAMIILAFRESKAEGIAEKKRLQREEMMSLQIRRLEAAHRIWYRTTSRTFAGQIGTISPKIPGPYSTVPVLHRRLFDNEELAKVARNWADYRSETPPELKKKFGDAAELVDEIAEYCRQLDILDPSKTITSFYRRRFVRPAGFFSGLRMLNDDYFIREDASVDNT